MTRFLNRTDCEKKGHGIRKIHISDFYINESRQCAWLTNPKVASSSIRRRLVPQNLELATRETPFRLIQLTNLMNASTEAAISKLRGYYFFSFVRHPETRLLSAYNNKINRYMQPNNVYRIKQQILEYLGRDPKDINQKVSFDDFIAGIVAQDPQDLNRHWQPQTLVLDLKRIHYNHIGRLETFRKSWETICVELDIPVTDVAPLFEKKQLKQSSSSEPVWVSPNTRALIEQYFADDYRNFDYQ